MSTHATDSRLGVPSHLERINFRMLIILAVFSLLVGTPVYTFVKGELNHGIEKAGDRLNVDLKAIGNFHFNDQTGTLEDIPAEYRKLDGKRVALEGYIAPTNSSDSSVNSFAFVYNVQRCCFGGPPLVQERVFATVPGNQTVDYTQEEIRIIGTLHVSADKDEVGKIEKLYSMDVERVEPL